MATITASTDNVRGVVWVHVDFASDPSVTAVRIYRVLTATGEEDTIRVHSWLEEDTDDCIVLVGSSTTVYDTEAPLDIPFTYRAEDCADDTNFVTSTEVVVASSNRFWLKDPVRPYANVIITLKGDQNPCVPVTGVYFRSMSEETYPGAGSIQRAVNRRNAVAVVRTRFGYSSVLNLATRTFVDRDAVRELLATGDVLFIQGPSAYGIEDVYVHVPSNPSWARLSSDHKRQWRLVAIPFDEVDQPAGMSYGIMGTRWEDLCDIYGSFAEMEAAGISWRDVMAGLAGNPNDSIVSGWRTYAMVDSEFATYAAITGYSTVVTDTFTRNLANQWGTADLGGTWLLDGGAAADYLTTGTQGAYLVASVSVARNTIIGDFAGDIDVSIGHIFDGTIPTGAPIEVGLLARWTDASNYYFARLFMLTNNTVLINIVTIVGGVQTFTTSNVLVPGVTTNATNISMRFQIRGNHLRARAWDNAGAEPVAWQVEMDATGLTGGKVGVRSILQAGNTNPLPVIFTFDNFSARTTNRTYQELLEGD